MFEQQYEVHSQHNAELRRMVAQARLAKLARRLRRH
jgi:hypothetical protein